MVLRPRGIERKNRRHDAACLGYHAGQPSGGEGKTADDGILTHCIVCRTDEVFIHNWQKTEWAGGMMEPVPAELGGPPVH